MAEPKTNMSPEHELMAEITALRAENATLKSEIAALRSTNPLPTETTNTSARSTFNFLGLPRELRNAIYDYCVVVGEVRGKRPAHIWDDDMRFQTPRKSAAAEVQVFLVSKQVRDEALKRYESRNDFVVPVMRLPFDMDYLSYSNWPVRRVVNITSSSHVRSISISIDHRQWNRSSDDSAAGCRLFGSRQYQASPDANYAIVKHLHDTEAKDICQEAVCLIHEVLHRCPKLRELQLNVQNTYCRLDCHRVIGKVLSWMPRQLKLADCQTHTLKNLDFPGTINASERDLIRHMFPENFQSCITFHGARRARHDADGYREKIWDPSVEIHDTPPESWTLARYNPSPFY